MPPKLTLEHSDSNSSTDSAASSVGSDSTVSSKGNECGSDGNSSDFHHNVSQRNFSGLLSKSMLVQQFGLSPPSESRLLQRRFRETADRKMPGMGRKGIIIRDV